MLNIEIKGVQFSNKGAELMLVAILEQLDKELGDYQITLSPGRLLPYEKRARLAAWQKLSFRRGKLDLTGLFAKLPYKFHNLFKRYGIVTERDIDVILDASGFAYGEQWGVKSLAHTAKEVRRYHQAGKSYIFLPQALGPFERPEIKQLAKHVFSKAKLVFPRDENSFQAVTQVVASGDAQEESLQGTNTNRLSHIKQSPDFTCLVEPEPFEKYQNKALTNVKQSICFIPNNKMVSKFYHDSASDDQQSYLAFFVKAGRFYQAQGWQVVLLNHEGIEDQKICQQIQEKLCVDEAENTVEIIQGLSAVEIKAFIGSVDAVLSSRFHGCVSALTQGIPCLATSWSHKYQMLFKEYGIDDNVLDFKINEAELIESLTQFQQTLAEQKKLNLAHAHLVKEETRNMWKHVFLQLSSNKES